MRALLLVLVFFSFFLPLQGFAKLEKGSSLNLEREKILFQRGLRQFKIGSYSTALEYFLKALKPNSPYYRKALLMLAKTYYAIGRKTGEKKYLWQALNYIQLYFITFKEDEQLPWDYYYTKAKIYESLGFYEQALALYRVAFLAAKTEDEKIKTTVGIIRTAVWIRRPDMADEYYILISTSNFITPQEDKELEFVRGLMLFSKGRYKEALPFFFKVYRQYENYLIDNPEYYYYVAENVYRTGNLKLAEQLFRRIVSLTKDPLVVRKSILRLGDIELRRGNRKLAFVYYYSVIRDYPETQEAQVARLKIIPMMKYPEIKYRTELTKDKAFKDPIKYVAQILVNYRTTYVGVYALADLGYLVFKIGSPESVFKRLTWEVSLIFPQQVKYEQAEFFRSLWSPYLLSLPAEKMCELYRSNPEFFQSIFSRQVLLKVASDLKMCNMRRLRIKLLEFMIKKWNTDEDIILMAKALYDSREFEDALRFLSKVKDKHRCDYWKLVYEISIFLPEKRRSNLKPLETACRSEDLTVTAIKIYYLSANGKLENAFNLLKSNVETIVKEYNKSAVVKAAVDKFLDVALLRGNYGFSYALSKWLLEGGEKDCYTYSYFTISSVRLGRIKEAKSVLPDLKLCKDDFAKLAEIVYQDAVMQEELR
ncbi:hypothetical protein SAMN06265339_1154 [Desulfurobacterium pacificum]|uniref:Tetratricopeptide repeat protein n=1 Tax=Desulfurobacterium pacificum TaxID=240166 RepID=A0ABY1NMS3_9BACT|nr:hypothetical protein [Desulfurobacterium pacificum]SMP13769.1 hypothetical protein SAMN06265339_1154 [Desulfurobacterium pacificum]